MKKLIMFTFGMLACMSSMAEDKITVETVTIPQGGTGLMRINLSNPDTQFAAFQFRLTTAEGISIAKDVNNNYLVEKGERISTEDFANYSITTTSVSATIYDLLAYQLQTMAFPGTNGTIVNITLKVDESLTVGTTLQCTLSDIRMSDPESTKYLLDDVTFTVTIGEPADTRTVLNEESTTVPASATNVDVRVLRTIKANQWSTICLPFAMTETQVKECFGDDVQLADFTGYDTEEDDEDNIVGLTINFNDVSAIEENHPYIIKVSSAITEFTVDGVEINPVSEPMINKGTKKFYKKFIGTYVANTTLEANTLFLNSNNFYYSTGLTKMKAFRAYFDFFDILTEVEEASSVKLWVNDDDDATGIESIDHSSLTIDHRYNLAGQRVGKNYKGIVIENGKKIKK